MVNVELEFFKFCLKSDELFEFNDNKYEVLNIDITRGIVEAQDQGTGRVYTLFISDFMYSPFESWRKTFDFKSKTGLSFAWALGDVIFRDYMQVNFGIDVWAEHNTSKPPEMPKPIPPTLEKPTHKCICNIVDLMQRGCTCKGV